MNRATERVEISGSDGEDCQFLGMTDTFRNSRTYRVVVARGTAGTRWSVDIWA